MNALTRFNANTPVKFDVMNTMCTEVEARDVELAQQINVLNNDRGYLNTKDCGTGHCDTITENGKYKGDIKGMPVNGLWVIDVTKNSDSYIYQHARCIYDSVGLGYTGVSFERQKIGEWQPWQQIATTTTVTADLPVASGFINHISSSYIKKTNNVIEVAINVKKSDDTTFGNNTTIATLPSGYRPSKNIIFSLRGTSTSIPNGPCYAVIGSTGTISLRCDSVFQEVLGIVSFTI